MEKELRDPAKLPRDVMWRTRNESAYPVLEERKNIIDGDFLELLLEP
jgi:hypothetical protein